MSDHAQSDSPPERRSTEAFDAMYAGSPPWDIGRPQPAFRRLAESGRITGKVLDVGCGTGEHVLMLAELGLEVTGVDAAPTAIAAAEAKLAERALSARLLVGNALLLRELDTQFDTIIDSGLFHVFDDEDRARYIEALSGALQPGGHYFMCCFSDRQPGDWGPRRVTEAEIRSAFSTGWTIESLEATEFETNLEPVAVQAWMVIACRS